MSLLNEESLWRSTHEVDFSCWRVVNLNKCLQGFPGWMRFCNSFFSIIHLSFFQIAMMAGSDFIKTSTGQ